MNLLKIPIFEYLFHLWQYAKIVTNLLFKCFSKNGSTKILCEPCSTADEQVKATHFCRTCDDPEPLCETCSEHHLKQKLSKNHELCADTEQFQNQELKKW